jgi:hypothetical protein
MLPSAAVQWPTPSARDWRSGLASEDTHGRNSRPLNEVASRATPLLLTTEKDGLESSLSAQTSLQRSQLNPAFVEWLMGWPEGWSLPYVRTACEPAVTESIRNKQLTPGEDSGAISSDLPSVA